MAAEYFTEIIVFGKSAFRRRFGNAFAERQQFFRAFHSAVHNVLHDAHAERFHGDVVQNGARAVETPANIIARRREGKIAFYVTVYFKGNVLVFPAREIFEIDVGRLRREALRRREFLPLF